MPGSIVLKNLELEIRLAAGRDYGSWTGSPGIEVIGKRAADLVPAALAKELERKDQNALETGSIIETETEARTADGRTRKFLVTRFPVRNVANETIGVGIIHQDVTEQRQTENYLRHTQRLEAIGQLTGGIAHDFNNLLTVVIGNLELMADFMDCNTKAEAMRKNALSGAERGAHLTQRLLSFSRRQDLNPVPVDIGSHVASILDLLRRTVEETIELETKIGKELPSALVDPSQLEAAIVNLIVNARDAIPESGRITVAADRVYLGAMDAVPHRDNSPAGHYIAISVVDDGVGMSRDVVDHAFEPFFTTKAVGAGTGLGLSMVHGFISQSGGRVTIDSQPGRGTCVTMYLPVADTAASRTTTALPAENEEPRPTSNAVDKSETILVVEDDADLRDLVERSLQGMGYCVLTAANRPTAVETAKGQKAIDFVLSDVILPDGMLGPDVARALIDLHPNAKVLLMSGYTRDAFDHEQISDQQFALIQKPFSPKALSRQIRQILDESVAG